MRRIFKLFIAATILIVSLAATTRLATAQIMSVEAYSGSPYGVGRITMGLAQGAETIAGDDRFYLDETNHRARYAAAQRKPVRQVLRNFLNIQRPARTEVYFLFQGNQPLDLVIHYPQPIRVRVQPINDVRNWQRFLGQWWNAYTGMTDELQRAGDYPVVVENFLMSTLSRRLRLEVPNRRRLVDLITPDDPALAVIIGTEKLRSDIQRNILTGRYSQSEQASLPLPDMPQQPRISFPEPIGEIPIEPIAMHVPEECLYVRFGNFTNYLWLDEFVENWGGDLRNMIAMRGVNYRFDQRLQYQLSLKQTKLAKVLGPTVISDVAFVGYDAFMREGAAFGMLFEARNNYVLGNDFTSQRAQTQKSVPNCTEKTVVIAGRKVSFLSTPDNRVRSFYAVDGNYHLVTTSETIVRRFFETGQGKGVLGKTMEFRNARQQMPLKNDYSVFAYLSEPFFNKFVTPQYRIEMMRRLRASSEMELVELARLFASSEGKAAYTIDELVAADALPSGFADRQDGSRIIEKEDHLLDSLRGAQGTFTPVPDVKVQQITASELRDYQEFLQFYRDQWGGRMDPMMIGLQRDIQGKGREKMLIEMYITPYAPSHYAKVRQWLGAPTRIGVAPVRGDLVFGQAVLGRTLLQPTDQDYFVFGSLHDFPSPFSVSKGRLAPDDSMRQIVKGYVGAYPFPGLLPLLFGQPGQSGENGYSRLPSGNAWVREWNDFTVISFQKGLLDVVTPQLKMVEYPRPAQIRIHAEDLSKAQLREGINAYGYQRARQTSLSSAKLMNTVARQFHVPYEDARDTAERMLGANILCSLDGEFQLVTLPGGLKMWTSDAVISDNRLQLSKIPSDYELPLLKWFRGLDLEALVTNDTIYVRLELDMQNPNPQPGSSGLFNFTFPTLPATTPEKQPEEVEPEEIPPPKPMPPSGEKPASGSDGQPPKRKSRGIFDYLPLPSPEESKKE